MGHAAKTVLRSGTVLHHKYAHAFAVGDSGITVNHMDAGTFLPEHNGPNSSDGRSFQQRLIRHAADELHTLQTQDIGDRCNSVHV